MDHSRVSSLAKTASSRKRFACCFAVLTSLSRHNQLLKASSFADTSRATTHSKQLNPNLNQQTQPPAPNSPTATIYSLSSSHVVFPSSFGSHLSGGFRSSRLQQLPAIRQSTCTSASFHVVSNAFSTSSSSRHHSSSREPPCCFVVLLCREVVSSPNLTLTQTQTQTDALTVRRAPQPRSLSTSHLDLPPEQIHMV